VTARTRNRPRHQVGAIVLALASIGVLGAAFVRFVLFTGSVPSTDGRSPNAITNADARNDRRGPTVVSTPPPEPEVKTIFDGTSGRGWMLCDHVPVPPRNIQPDGLNPHGTGSYLVVYERKLGDFALDFDYKLTRGCNSGVFLRVSDLKNPINTGIEIALDDTTGTGRHDPGAIDDLVGPRVQTQKPAGVWNHMTITAEGPRIRVALNGTDVSAIDLDLWTVPGKRPDGKDHKFKNVALARLARRGYVGFQDLGGDCWYRKIVVRNNQPATS